VDPEFFSGFPEIKETQKIETAIVNDATNPVLPPVTNTVIQDRETIISGISTDIIDIIPTFSLYSSFEDLLPSEKPVTELQNSKAIQDFEKVFETKLINIANISDTREREMAIRELQNKATDDFNDCRSQSIESQIGNQKYSFTVRINESEPKKIEFMIE